MKKIITRTICLFIIGSSNFITASGNKNTEQNLFIAYKQAEQKLQKFQREQAQREENQREEDRQKKIKEIIDSHSGRIRTFLNIEQDSIKKHCYESDDETSISRQVNLKDGSYFITKFDKTTIEPIETRLYQQAENDDYLNTKLTVYYNNGIADVLSLDIDSGRINCRRIVQLGYNPATLTQPPYKEYQLNKNAAGLKLKNQSRAYLDDETIIEQIKIAQELGNVIDMIEVDTSN